MLLINYYEYNVLANPACRYGCPRPMPHTVRIYIASLVCVHTRVQMHAWDTFLKYMTLYISKYGHIGCDD